MISITTNISQFNAKLQAKAAELNVRLVGTVNRLSEKFVSLVHNGDSPASNARRQKGWLANSVRPIPAEVKGPTVIGGVEAAGGAAWYGRLFEDGTTTPYSISPANKKVLRFELGGEMVYRRNVQHPPFNREKLAFMAPVREIMRPEAQEDIMTTVLEVLNS